jgi:ABC-2 type transport system permease protein
MRGVFATMRAAFLEASANRRALVFQVTVMVLNDLAWVAFWMLFFRRAGTVRGWDIHKIVLLQAVLTTAGGLVLGLMANARNIAALAANGGLDATLGLPVRPLAQLLVRRVEPTNFGDTLFGIGLFAVAGHPTPARVCTFVLCVIGSSVLLASFLVVTGSLSFYAGQTAGGELGFHSILLLAAYPIDVFGGSAKFVLYTVVPAAFVASVPAGLIQQLNLRMSLAFVAVALIFSIVAAAVFRAALRRYTSGSSWTRA